MGLLGIRSSGLVLLLAGALSMFWTTTINAQVTETSIEGQNITVAANFIRSMGMDEVADQIAQALKDGEIYQDNLTGGDLGKTSPATKDITIDNQVLGKGGIGTQLFDSKIHFGQIFHLAMVLYHENVHKHQGLSIRIRSVIGKEPDEWQAWTRTLAAATDWIDTLWRQYTKLGRSTSAEDKAARTSAAKALEGATALLASEADDFVKARKAFGYDQTPWKRFQKLTEDLRGLAVELSRAETQGKDVTEKQRTDISNILSDSLKAEKAVIGDLPKPKKLVRQPPTRIQERPRKQVRQQTDRGRLRHSAWSALRGGRCPGAVPGATLRQADPDVNVLAAMTKECPHLVGGAGGGGR